MATEPQRQPYPKDFTVHVGRLIEAIIDGDQMTDKDYVDNAIAVAIGDNVSKMPVDATTNAALPANTRTAEVLKADAVGAFPAIDGVAAGLGKSYLVKDEGGVGAHINDGIYTLTVLGDGATEWELTRRNDLTNGEGASGAMTHADDGTVNKDVQFKCINNIGSDVVNTDALQFDFWGETVDHSNLKNLNWDVAGHVMNTVLDMNSNQINEVTDGTLDQDAATVKQVPILMGVITDEPTGFPNRTDSVLSFVNGTRTFTIAPAVTDFDFYVKGVKYTKNAGVDKIITDVEGLHYLYFDAAGDLQVTVTESDALYLDFAFVAIISWDSTNTVQIYLGDERHGLTMDGATHLHLHESIGTIFENGLALDSILADQDGSLDTHAQCGVEIGEIDDEDLHHDIAAEVAPANIPVYYKLGAAGDWRKIAADNFPVETTGTGRLAWNEFTGGAWQQTEVTDNRYTLSHIAATNDPDVPLIVIMGQSDYATLNAARNGAEDELNTLVLAGLPFKEFKFIGTIIFQTKDTYANTVKARIRSTNEGDDYVDWRQSVLSPHSPPGQHGLLSGRSELNQHPASAIAPDTTNFAGKLTAADDTVQKALDTLDDAAPLAHKDSHDPEDGSDPLDCAAPGSIDENVNAEGTSHSFARADHNHQHLAALHENGGGAEISVLNLSGLLADAQTPLAHKDTHDPEDGSDPLDAAAPGSIDENVNAEGTSHSFARADHNHQHTAALHENGGGAEISVAGLSGQLADDQPALAHNIGGAKHNADTLANLNTKVSDLIATFGGIRDIGIGTLAQRPAAGTANRFWWATDNDLFYFDDGAAWDTIDAEPIAHAGTHVTGGGDTIADAIAAGNAGLMSGADKTKLDGIEALADVTATHTCDTPGGAGTDTTAIHDNVAGEIMAIAPKTVLAANDEFILEDSGAADVKKAITATNLGNGLQPKQVLLKVGGGVAVPTGAIEYTVGSGILSAVRANNEVVVGKIKVEEIWVYAISEDVTGGSGDVTLLDDGGATLATVNIPNGGPPGWYSAVGLNVAIAAGSKVTFEMDGTNLVGGSRISIGGMSILGKPQF